MTTIADSLQNATDAVAQNAAAYLAAAAAVNNEIGAVAGAAGIDPTTNIGSRFVRAVRSGGLTYGIDTSPVAGVIRVAFSPAHTAYRAGQPFAIKLAQDIAGPTVINVDGLGNIPVRFPGGGELQKFDYRAGDLIELINSAAANVFTVTTPVANLIIDAAISKTVHGVGADFPDLNAAFAWLSRRRIALTGSVIFNLAVGVNANKVNYATNVTFSHPDGARVSLVGAPLSGALPAGASLSFTGNSVAARAADNATNLTLLRNFYTSEVAFVGGASFTGFGNLGGMQDVLITTDGSANVDGLTWSNGVVTLTRVASIGASRRGLFAFGARIGLNGTCYALGNGTYGASAESGGILALADGATLVASSNGSQGMLCNSGLAGPVGSSSTGTVYARGNGGDGVASINAGTINLPASAISRDNGNNGFTADSGSIMRASGTLAQSNGAAAYYCGLRSGVDATNTTGTGNGTYGYVALNGGFLIRTGGAATGATAAASPTVGSSGNNSANIA